MTVLLRRQAVTDKYAEIIGRNLYSQSLQDYCYKSHKDDNYYSDCSSSICCAYQQAGQGFGITNIVGMYNSTKLTTVDADIAQGIPDTSRLRPGGMLLFVGMDASRPKRIGHVEMYCGDGIICGHGSGKPFYKDLVAYCKSRYNSWASGDWRKGLVAVKRYIQDDAVTEPEEPRLLGWRQNENGTKSFHLGNIGDCVRDSWYLDTDGKWYWLGDAGRMVTNTWYQYKGDWYYLGADGAVVKGLRVSGRKWYYPDQDGKLSMDPVILTLDQDGALRWPGMGEQTTYLEE